MILINFYTVVAAFALALDAVPMSGATPGILDSAGRITLDGVLVLVAITLWKAGERKDQLLREAIREKDAQIAEKDKQIITITTKVTEVMTEVMLAAKELRTSVDEMYGKVATACPLAAQKSGAGAGKR